jgi:hypothetical protein
MYCSAAGSCVTPTGSTPVGVPDGQGGSHPVVVPPAPPPSHIGALNGMFSVSEQGTSEYTVPIDVPPGRAGMQPVLSLKYAGSKTNGDLGMGWHLDGLSTITRCPAINALDKGARPVEGLSGGPIQTTGDHFCIDGKRLETVAGVGGGAPGNYGADGTEYRTLIDSFARIVSNQDASDIQPDPDPNVIMLPPSLEGPDSFHVWTKDGKILTYGGTRDSLVMKRDGARSTWLLRRVEDRAGNTMTIGYRNVPAALSARFNGGNAVRPDVISYTGHGDDPGNREVKFMYENRADPQLMFLQGGVPMMAEQRLMRIVTYLKGKAVKNYHIGYEEVAGVATSQISTISECTEDGDTHCKNPTKFDYEDDSGFTLCDAEDKKTCSGPSITDSAGKLDANGDGIPDYLLMKAIQHPVDPSPWLTVAQIAADVALAVATSGASTAVQIGASAVWAQASPSIWALFAKSPDVEINSTMYLGTGDRTLPTRFNGSVSGIP